MKITPQDLQDVTEEYMTRNSGFEARRDYVSLSHLGECSRQIVKQFREGYPMEAHTHRMCYAGYEHEQSLRRMLDERGLIENEDREITAPFDSRLRGHLDGDLEGDIVVELKSVSNRQWKKMLENGRVLWKHFVQVQMYMRYGKYRRALVVYRNRDTYEHHVIEVPYNEAQAARFENKAREILKAIDEGRLPECDCGQCTEKA